MACSDRDKAVFGVNELPEIVDVSLTDLFIVETPGGTNTSSFGDFNVDISQTTFKSEFDSHTTDIAQLSAEADSKLTTTNFPTQLSELRSRVDSLKALVDYASQLDDPIVSGGDYDLLYAPSKLNTVFGAQAEPHVIPIVDYIGGNYSTSDVRGSWIAVNTGTEANQTYESQVEVLYPDNNWKPLYTYSSVGVDRSQNESQDVVEFIPVVAGQSNISIRIIGGDTGGNVQVRILGFRLLILNEVVITTPNIPDADIPDIPGVVIPPAPVVDFSPETDMSWVGVSNTGDTPDIPRGKQTAGYGSVTYGYRIGKYAVREKEVDKYNEFNPSLTIGNTGFKRGPNRPVTNMSLLEMMWYVNWLNNIEGYPPAYNMRSSDVSSSTGSSRKWSSEQAWTFGGENLYRNKLSKYFIATEDEWYKAAFYGGQGYLYYPYASSYYPWEGIIDEDPFRGAKYSEGYVAPPPLAVGTTDNRPGAGFVFTDSSLRPTAQPVDVDKCGEFGPHGTQGQSGNVKERVENGFYRGGFWKTTRPGVSSVIRPDQKFTSRSEEVGFRLVQKEGTAGYDQSIIDAGFPPYEPPTVNDLGIGFNDITDANNSDDDTGYGGVSYNFKLSRYATSESAFKLYNTDPGNSSLILPIADPRGDFFPVQSSWVYAARFINWMNKISGYTAAYKFVGDVDLDDVPVEWVSGDTGYDAANKIRNKNAKYWLPSEDEWYKAAFYDRGSGFRREPQYWDYAFGSDDPPTAIGSGDADNTAVYAQGSQAGPAEVNKAGGLSPYGTMGQTGNTYELLESSFGGLNDATSNRVRRGGYYGDSAVDDLSVNTRKEVADLKQSVAGISFRVASKA